MNKMTCAIVTGKIQCLGWITAALLLSVYDINKMREKLVKDF